MSNQDLTQVESVFHAVLERAPGDRKEFLEEACNGDQLLYAEVLSLISAYDSREGFIAEPALNLGFRVLSSITEQSMIGNLIGPYRIISRLGKGGMGEVYLAEDTKLGRKVALKFLSPEFIGDNWAKRQLIKEAQSVAQLDHPNICSVYGFEEHGEHSFIVMQYVEGETLSELIRKGLVLTQEIPAVAHQIVSAVAAAHSHAVIHRDIKPTNIMVTPQGQVKVLDFGLAKTIETRPDVSVNDTLSNLSGVGVLKGTIAYMSPEQLRGEKLDFRSDVFSLGTVLYELISGANPFAHGNSAETISAILTLDPPRVVDSHHDLLRDLSQIVHKSLRKSRDERYNSASELLFALSAVQESSKISAHRMPAINARLIATLAICIIALAVAIFVYRSWTKTYRLAVLPFTNESGDPGLDYLEDGFPENLITKVSKLPRIRVNAFTTVSAYKGRRVDPQQLGRELNVDAVLVGRIVQLGNSTVMQTDLISTSDNYEIWGERYDIKTIALSDLEENLIGRVAAGLTAGLGLGGVPALPVRETKSNEAFLEYLRGRHLWNKRNKDNLQKAIEKFRASIDLDPAFARAHAGLADCYALLNSPAYGNLSTDEAMRMAKAEANQALTIDPVLPEALTSLGVITLKYDWNWYEAERLLRQSIREKSDYALSHYWFANLLTITGRLGEALTESSLAKQLDPNSSSMKSNFCRQHYYLRDYNRAASCLDTLLGDEPNNIHARYFQIFVLIRQGDVNKALEVAQTLSDQDRAFKVSALGYALGQAGKYDEAKKVLEEAETLQRRNLIPPMEMAVIYLGMGNKDELFVWLNKAYADRSAALIYLTADPAFDSVRSDERFLDLAHRLNLQITPVQSR